MTYLWQEIILKQEGMTLQHMTGYFTFGQLQQVKQEWFDSHQEGLSFKEAVQILIETGQISNDVPQKPDFLSWNLMDIEDLRNRINSIPISLAEIQYVKSHIKNCVNYLSIQNEVQIAMESCYTKQELVVVDYFSVIYVLDGCCVLAAKEKIWTMKKGELCILPPGMPYYILVTLNDMVFNISSNRANFEKQFDKLLDQDNIVSAFLRNALLNDAKDCLFFMIYPTKDLKSIIQHLFSEFVQKDDYSESLFYYYLQIFYINIIRSTRNTGRYYIGQKETTAKMLMPAILQYINSSYHNVTLDELAEQFHYDSSYLSRFIKASTGKNFSTIITELKMQEAHRLLKNTDLSITKIARQIGYNSADHFTYSFKKYYGMSPVKFRRAFRILY